MRIAWLGAALLGGLGLSIPASASGDYACEPAWKLASAAFSSCGNRAMLSPGNDTRVNLFYLLRDRQGVSSVGLAYPTDGYDARTLGHSFFSWRGLRSAYFPQTANAELGQYYGSRCISLASGEAAFAAALAASGGLPAAERAALTEARGRLIQRCDGSLGEGAIWPAVIKSAAGREFLGYLQAADAFYAEQWDTARQEFSTLRTARDSWLAEAAAYMLPRTELNAAQAAAFDEYGSFSAERVDRAALARARTGLAAYLQRYGQGRYARSATGLSRRVLWLSGDAVALAREYERMFAVVPAGDAASTDLVEEVDNKLIGFERRTALEGPMLLATIDLMMMRPVEEGAAGAVITAAQLAAQEPRFAGNADLFGFVLAAHAFHVEKDMAKVLRLLPDDARRPGYSAIAFSRQMLRGMALAARKDRNEAGFWRELLGGAKGMHQRPLVELALAMHHERSGQLAQVFAGASPIQDTAIREILMLNVAGPEVLRAQARDKGRPRHERDLALFTLLRKQLSHGDYTGYLADSAMAAPDASTEGGLWDLRMQETVPIGLFRAGKWADDYACPALSATAAALARDARDPRARLCLGEFYRLNGFDGLDNYSARPAPDELGGTPSQFPGREMTRGDLYAAVIADPRAAGEQKAYALYRAVNCYAPSGNNECGGAEAPQGTRRAWFQQLKRDFPRSEWAGKLRYYW